MTQRDFAPAAVAARRLLIALLLGAAAMTALGGSATAGTKEHDHDWTYNDDDDAWTAADESRAERFTWADQMTRGKTLTVRGLTGRILVTRATGDRAAVRARKSGKRSDPSKVKIEVVEHSGGILICARYPRPDGRLNDCDPDDHNQNVKNNDVQVRFEVEIPDGVHFEGRNVNGDVDVEGMRGGNVSAATVNGSVNVSTTGWAEATTVNGSIRAEIGDPDFDQPLEFSTVNGGIMLTMPNGVDANVRASTVNGEIESDFPITTSGRISRRKLSGTLGRGGPELRLATVNGSIELRSND